jgi:hypothetical protein
MLGALGWFAEPSITESHTVLMFHLHGTRNVLATPSVGSTSKAFAVSINDPRQCRPLMRQTDTAGNLARLKNSPVSSQSLLGQENRAERL